MLFLTTDYLRYRDSYLTALQEEARTAKDPQPIEDRINAIDDYLQYIQALASRRIGNAPRQTRFWLVDSTNQKYLGEIHIRQVPRGRHSAIASHVYYEIQPSFRGRGYGAKILELGLEQAHKLGVRELIAVCDESNVPSRKIIERNGGLLISKTILPGESTAMLKYRISLIAETTREILPRAA